MTSNISPTSKAKRDKSGDAQGVTNSSVLLRRWSPLMFSLSLTLSWLGFMMFSMSMLHYKQIPTLYPLLLAAHSQNGWIVVSLLVVGMIILHVRARQKGLYRGWLALSLLLHFGLLLIAFTIALWPPHAMKHLQAFPKDEHTYQLAHVQDGGPLIWGRQTYLVLKCDSMGLFCEEYARPYTRYGYCFVHGAWLDLSPLSKEFVLYVPASSDSLTEDPLVFGGGTHVYPVVVVPHLEQSQPNCPMKGLTR